MSRRQFNILVLSDFKGIDANVVRDFLYSFNKHSRHRYYYLHSWTKNNCRRLWSFDFDRFDAIVLFWDFYWVGSAQPGSYCYVPSWAAERIANSAALKIQFLQDEYRDVRKANHAMARLGVNLMFSCAAKNDHELLYPKSLIPTLIETYPVLTGYVPSYLEHVRCPASLPRSIDIGYRSRKLPYYLGALGQEKHIIAERFQRIADEHGFSADISVNEKDRIYGQDWLTFLRSSRFSLATESGASVIDFDGTIKTRCLDYVNQHPAASFEETRQALFEGIDGRTVIQTISPRIFEAAAFENTLIMHEGHYEGMVHPDVHYIEVKKDYSNIQGVIERMKDRGFCEKLAAAARKELIDSGKYNYKAFAAGFDESLDRHVEEKVRRRSPSRVVFYLMNHLNDDRLLPHEDRFLQIPRGCDVASQGSVAIPYGLALIYSVAALAQLWATAPYLLAALLGGLLASLKRTFLLPQILKDLRALSLAMQARRLEGRPGGPDFKLALSYSPNVQQLLLRSVPREEGKAGVDSRASDDFEALIVERALLEGLQFVSWDHHLIGVGLPLPITNSNGCILFLNDDGIYRFETFAIILEILGDRRAEFVRALLSRSEAPLTWPQQLIGLAKGGLLAGKWLFWTLFRISLSSMFFSGQRKDVEMSSSKIETKKAA